MDWTLLNIGVILCFDMREHKTTPMREIGYHIKAEQGMSDEDITWMIAMAQAILRAFCWNEGQPMRHLAESLGISPQTLYTTLRLVVAAMKWVRRKRRPWERWLSVLTVWHTLNKPTQPLRPRCNV